MAVFSVIPVEETRNFTVGGVLNDVVDGVSLAICYPNLFPAGGIGPRIVEPIINASIAITAALENLQSHELTLDSNLPAAGRKAYGTLDHLIKAKQGSIVVKVADTRQPLTSASEEHQRTQMLIQMATARDIDQYATAALEDYTKDLFGVLASGQEWLFFKYVPGSSSVEFQKVKLRETEGERMEAIAPRVKEMVTAMVSVIRHQSGAR